MSFNFRDELESLTTINLVRIKSCGAIYKNLHNDSRIKLPKEISENIVDTNIDLRNETGKIVHIFTHPALKNKPNVYVIKLEPPKADGKYVLIGKTGIKKLGNIILKINDEIIKY